MAARFFSVLAGFLGALLIAQQAVADLPELPTYDPNDPTSVIIAGEELVMLIGMASDEAESRTAAISELNTQLAFFDSIVARLQGIQALEDIPVDLWNDIHEAACIMQDRLGEDLLFNWLSGTWYGPSAIQEGVFQYGNSLCEVITAHQAVLDYYLTPYLEAAYDLEGEINDVLGTWGGGGGGEGGGGEGGGGEGGGGEGGNEP